jgi:hypothetical protein
LKNPGGCLIFTNAPFGVYDGVDSILLFLNDKCCLSTSHKIKVVNFIPLLVTVSVSLHEERFQVLANPDEEALAANTAK